MMRVVMRLSVGWHEDEKGCDEDCTRKRHKHLGALASEVEQDDDDQRVLQEVVVEGREKLAPEERCKAPASHERAEHDCVLPRFPANRERRSYCISLNDVQEQS